MAAYQYTPIVVGRDALIVDYAGVIQGIRNHAGVEMINGVSTQANLMGGGRTTLVSGEVFTIPVNSQSIIAGGVSIQSGGSITTIGEFVAIRR